MLTDCRKMATLLCLYNLVILPLIRNSLSLSLFDNPITLTFPSLTDCFFRLGELHFSLADYHQALEIDPHDSLTRGRIAAIHSEFGSVDYEEHSYQDAEARFTVAIQHNPRNSQYYLSRAKVRFMLEVT